MCLASASYIVASASKKFLGLGLDPGLTLSGLGLGLMPSWPRQHHCQTVGAEESRGHLEVIHQPGAYSTSNETALHGSSLRNLFTKRKSLSLTLPVDMQCTDRTIAGKLKNNFTVFLPTTLLFICQSRLPPLQLSNSPLTLISVSVSRAINQADIQRTDAVDQWCLQKKSWTFAGTTLSGMPASVALPTNHYFHPSLSPVVSLSLGILHEWMRTQMLAKPSWNVLQRTGGDHRGSHTYPGRRTFMMTCLHWILGYMRLEIWCKIIGLSANCLCTALCTRSDACSYWIGTAHRGLK